MASLKSPDFLTNFDGSGRCPREAQEKILRELMERWDDYQCHAVIMPTGGGKSGISRAIQLATNGLYLTSTNVLVDQYCGQYRANRFVGEDHYSNAGAYSDAKMKAMDPENMNAMNPCSFRVAAKAKAFRRPPVIIFDEADQALSLLHSLATTTLSLQGIRNTQKLLVPQNAAQFCLSRVADMRADAEELRIKRKLMDAIRKDAKADKLEDLANLLLEEPERFAVNIEEKHTQYAVKRVLQITPTFLPKGAARRFFGESKIILLSATLLPSHVQELTGGIPFHRIESESPIPVERRKIFLKPCEEVLSAPVDYDALASKIDEVLTELPYRPAIIHTVYRDAEELHRRMRTQTIVYNKQMKQEKLDEWMRSGGVILASGATTGLDLKHDLVRLNIISKLCFASLGSDLVQKRLALPGGKRSYALSAARDFIQASGRSTRSETDWSVTVVLDGRLPRLYKETSSDLPNFIKQAIEWADWSYQKIRDHIDGLK
jgi:Rad3-related DNA helicase